MTIATDAMAYALYKDKKHLNPIYHLKDLSNQD